MQNHALQPRAAAAGEIDGFFGLFVDNLVQILVITALLTGAVGMPREVVLAQVLPAVGLSVILGNLIYAAQALRARIKTGRRHTALPYGVNTPTVFVYILFIMIPTARETGQWEPAYAAGMLACIGSGLIEFFGAFFARAIRAATPRAALLSAIAGIALTFISLDFFVRIVADPLIGLLPLLILLAGYFGGARMPLGLPAGLVALLVGAIAAWALTFLDALSGLGWLLNEPANLRSAQAVTAAAADAALYPCDPRVVWPFIVEAFESRAWLSHLAVIIPMGLFNLAGSLQNLESAEAGGDSYSTTGSLVVNGLGSIAGGFLGSCFPTTIYIGHPGWKAMGAGWVYSLLNALAIAAICFTGVASMLDALIPVAAGACILLWIAVTMTVQAFQASPPEHGGAVAVGLFPAIAGLLVMAAIAPYNRGPDLPASASSAQVEAAAALPTLQDELTPPDDSAAPADWSGLSIHGLVRIERGLIITSMIWAAVVVFLTMKQWRRAAGWLLAASILSVLGVIHGYAVSGNDLHYHILGLPPPDGALVRPAWDFALAYALAAGVFIAPSLLNRHTQRHLDDQAAALRRRMQEMGLPARPAPDDAPIDLAEPTPPSAPQRPSPDSPH